MRTWGLVFGAAALSSALTVAALTGCGAQTTTAASTTQTAATPATPAQTAEPAPPAAVASEGVFSPAQVESPPPAPQGARPRFLIRFHASHPMARAQNLAASAHLDQARLAALATLRTHHEFDGLCFSRFTLGGRELVLEACSAVSNPGAFARRWSRRLAAMPGVDYADIDRTAEPVAHP